MSPPGFSDLATGLQLTTTLLNVCFLLAGRSFEELAHKTFKYYEEFVKKFIPPSSCGYGQKHLSCWINCCGCPNGCEPKYDTTPLDKCLKNATLTRHRKFDKKTKLPLKSFLPRLAKVPRSEFEFYTWVTK